MNAAAPMTNGSEPLRIFIGFDPKEAVAYHVLVHSILRRASRAITVAPLARSVLRNVYTRERGPMESTDFSMTRFLVPYLAGYRGTAIFMDCDMVCLTDICSVLDEIDPRKAVSVCQHNYTPKSERKFLGHQQTSYPRKNWSSFMVFNAAECRQLTPEYVNTATGLELHRFRWLSDDQIGALPLEWNWLVGEYAPNPSAKLLHYTLGGPWFAETRHCEHSGEWQREHEALIVL